MKKIQIGLMSVAMAAVMASCGNNNGDATKNDTTTSTTTNTSTSSTDNDDASFLNDAAYGGMKEVAGGKVAQQKGMSKDIKELGKMMVTDHSAMNEKIKALAAKKNIQLRDSLSSDDADDIRNNKKTGADFDKEYASMMVDDHEKDIKKFEDAAQNSKDPDIKALANEALPKLRHHLEMAKAAKEKVKG